MPDYVGIALQGFSTGIGVIAANQAWIWFQKYRAQVQNNAKKMWEDTKNGHPPQNLL